MMHHFWRLSEGGDNNFGLACTNEGLVLGRTPLIERRGTQFVVRDRGEIERLFRRIDTSGPVDRIMPGLHTVASAMNANDPCLARIAAVHLRIPDLPDQSGIASAEGHAAESRLVCADRQIGQPAIRDPTYRERSSDLAFRRRAERRREPSRIAAGSAQ